MKIEFDSLIRYCFKECGKEEQDLIERKMFKSPLLLYALRGIMLQKKSLGSQEEVRAFFKKNKKDFDFKEIG